MNNNRPYRVLRFINRNTVRAKDRWHNKSYNKNRAAKKAPKAMKKTLKKAQRHSPSLGDLILAVSSVSRNNSEAVAAVADLLESGRVTLNSQGRKVRARLV